MKYFDGVKTPEEAKKIYYRLAMQFHPDRGGNAEVMKLVNAEYHEILARLHGHTSTGSDNKEHRYQYSRDVEQAVMDKLSEILGLRRDDIKVMLVGTWLWISGETRPIKDWLKANGYRWQPHREMWSFTANPYRHRGKPTASFAGMARTYGYREFKPGADKNDRLGS